MREANKAPRPTTVLNPLRPAVVVRRRVYDTTSREMGPRSPQSFTSNGESPAFIEAEEESPPSSINVAKALAALRADELERVEDLVEADDAKQRAPRAAAPEPPAPAPAAVQAPAVRTLRIGRTIALSELANRMGVSSQELPAVLVAQGFYAVDAKTVLSGETARMVAEMHGWQVEDAPDESVAAGRPAKKGSEPPPPAQSGTRSRISTKSRKVGTQPKPKARAKAKVAAKAKPKVKVEVKAKPSKRRIAR
jgi:hypothetical protein